ncbi:MAG: phosphoribosylformylglycinamidine synthase subunit PurQ [Thermodesulfobacteriota bacterium]|nr:phosphoribosylformylglycinamidine synthase subunit PurQ [Thermodesulfobacteriota bacterium]
MTGPQAKEREIRAVVLTGYGLNCDRETAYAFELAGAVAHRVHMNTLIAGEVLLSDYDILAFDGGFSWGDDHGAGVLEAVRFRSNMGEALHRFIEEGKLVIGICNGFQAIVNMGLLPGFDKDYHTRHVALTSNDCGNFRDDWVTLVGNADSPCVFTKGIASLEIPVRHGEGKLYAPPEVIGRLTAQQQVVLQYATPQGELAKGRFPYNPNGSVEDIAGICDPTGRIFGLMPHPEAFTHWTNHPDWTRTKAILKRKGHPMPSGPSEPTLGIKIFKNAVDYMREACG